MDKTPETMTCSKCGAEVKRARQRRPAVCKACKYLRQLAWKRDQRLKQGDGEADGRRKRKNEALIEIVSCPDNFFPRGGCFGKIDFMASCPFAAGGRVHACWLPGMVLRNRKTNERLKIGDDYRLIEA